MTSGINNLLFILWHAEISGKPPPFDIYSIEHRNHPNAELQRKYALYSHMVQDSHWSNMIYHA